MVGAGYVGLVTAAGLAELGHRVHLVEIREDRLELLRHGVPPIHEAGLAEALAAALAAGRLSVSGRAAERRRCRARVRRHADRPMGGATSRQLHGALSALEPVLEPARRW